MDFNKIITVIKDKGIPFLVLRDCRSKKPSILFTLLVLSAILVAIGVVLQYLGKTIDTSLAFNFFIANLTAYTTKRVSNNYKEDIKKEEV